MLSAASLCSSKPACLLARPQRAPRRAATRVLATAARDEGFDFSEGLSGEWSPNWSLGLPSRPQRDAPQKSRDISTRSSATEEGMDMTNAISGEWEATWSLASYEDVCEYYSTHKKDKPAGSS